MPWEDDNRRLRQLEQEAREWERKPAEPLESGPFPRCAGDLDQHNRLIEIRQLRQKVHGGN